MQPYRKIEEDAEETVIGMITDVVLRSVSCDGCAALVTVALTAVVVLIWMLMPATGV